MKIINCEQGTFEWHQARIGKITASRVHDILPGKNGYRAARKSYMAQIITEILTGNIQDSYCSQAMAYGKEIEKKARSAYEVEISDFVQEVGFIIHPTLGYLGSSPDGLLDDRGIEIKSPNTATHIETIVLYVDKKPKIQPNYYTQMQVGMMCTELSKWDYISYDERLPGNLQIYIQTIVKDSEYCKKIEKEVIKFYKELMETMVKLKAYESCKNYHGNI